MGRGKPRHQIQPETPIPVRPGAQESPARLRLRQEQLHRAEIRLEALLQRAEEAQKRLDNSVRDVNSILKSLRSENDKAAQAIAVLKEAIQHIVEGEVAEVIKVEVEHGLEGMVNSLRSAQDDAVKEILERFDHLSDILMGVTDAKGRKREEPNLEEIVMGVALNAKSLPGPKRR